MSIKPCRMLLTGGTGRLGQELIELLPGIIAPPRSEMDITLPQSVEAAISRYQPRVVIHAAAFTDVAGAERERVECWNVNVTGTQNLVRAVSGHPIRFIQVSTDYVFDGSRGMYSEHDVPGPVRNYYALTKLVAEQLVRLLPEHLVIRTSFRPREWPYPSAFEDVFTGQDYVDVIAPEIALAIEHCDEFPNTTLHIVTERKSVFALARRRKPDVVPGSKASVKISLPDDISLDITQWTQLKRSLQRSSE